MSQVVKNNLIHTQDSIWNKLIPAERAVQKGLLVLSVATAVISLIPPVRLAGALATRSIALLSSTLDGAKQATRKDHWSNKAASCAKVAIVALGLAGLAAASPALLIASLASDVGLQAIEMVRSAWKGDGDKALAHFAILVVDSLVLGAVVAGSWQLMVAAAAVNAFVMIGFFSAATRNWDKSKKWTDCIEPLCYASMSILGIATAVIAFKGTYRTNTNSKFSVKNTTGEPIKLYDKQGKLVGTVMPGESTTLEVPYKNTLQHTKTHFIGIGEHIAAVPVNEGSYLQGISFDPKTEAMINTKWDAASIDTIDVVYKHPLPVENFPKIPIGGNVVITPVSEVRSQALSEAT